ncbi:MAG: pitrilysin family protein [Pseudomonadota bacterium]
MTSGFTSSRRLRATALGAAAALATSASLAMAEAGDATSGPAVSDFELSNGMRGVVIVDRRAPVVTHMVWYRVGAADEPPGKSGIAHFLEHLMFKGTDDIPSGQFSKIVAENGGQDNAFTSLDYTAYFQRIAKDRLEMVMRMEADRMTDLALAEEDVRTERLVVLEERSSRTDTEPRALFGEQFNAALYLNHPYGVPVIGWRREIEALGRDDALDFYKRFYAPENAILVVAGDVSPDEVEALAKTHYGAIPRADPPQFERPQEPPQIAARRISMSDPKVRQPFMRRSYIAPSYVTAEPGRAEALAVLSDILGGGQTSRLNRALVLDQKISIGAGASYWGVARDDASFGVYGVPAPGVALEDVEAAIDAEIARMIEEGPTEEELERAKTVLVSAAIYRQDSQAGMARMYGSALIVGLTVEDVKQWPDRIQAVTAEDVKAAAAALDIRASVTGYLTGVEEAAKPAGQTQ